MSDLSLDLALISYALRGLPRADERLKAWAFHHAIYAESRHEILARLDDGQVQSLRRSLWSAVVNEIEKPLRKSQ